jgi:3D (Asp-Asp-Asp) domain-containing protein
MRRWLLLAGSALAVVVVLFVLLSSVTRTSPRARGAAARPMVELRRARELLAHATTAAARAYRPRPRPVRSRATTARCAAPPPEPPHPIHHPQWLSGVVITEYYPAPERWFTGRLVTAPGLPGRHPVDWFYSARGLAMEGDGITRRGQLAHIDALGSTYWVNAAGQKTKPVCLGLWSDGSPVWLRGGWRNRSGQVTYPLSAGGWSNGRGGRELGYGGVTFAPGASLPVRYYHSIAVDPKLIPEGSRVYIPAYKRINGGWFVAQDTGGAIKGRHIDVYRPAPASPSDLGRYMRGQRVYVIPPG